MDSEQAGRPVVGYVRVSTGRQAEEGVSLEAQERRIRAWCEVTGGELVEVHADAGLSGGKLAGREGLRTAVEAACRVRGVLVVYSLSRLSRSTKDTIEISERLDRAGCDLVSLSERIDTTGAAGRMMFRLLAVLAEFERDQIAERTRAALAHKRARGEATGGETPYGWRLGPDGRTLVEDEAEAAVVAMIRAEREAGTSYARIAEGLNARGVPAKCGGRWYAKTVRGVLLRNPESSAVEVE